MFSLHLSFYFFIQQYQSSCSLLPVTKDSFYMLIDFMVENEGVESAFLHMSN